MSFSKNSNSLNSAKTFIDFKPAEIKKNKRLQIVYYYKHPITNKFVRVRLSVPKVSPYKERKQLALSMMLEINFKLKNGWLPIYDNVGTNDFKTLDFCFELFLSHFEKDIKKGVKRPDTYRSYKSFISMIKKYITYSNLRVKMIFEFKKEFIINYLDWIYYDRQNSARTYNNHLGFIITFLNFALERGFVKNNQALGLKKKPKQEKKRKAFTLEVKTQVKKIKEYNKAYYCLCMATYYCFIRRTELTKLKVKDVDLINNSIVLNSEISKNKKTNVITIPKAYFPILTNHLKTANNNDFLFSANNFLPGPKKLTPKKISDYWTSFKKKNKISKEYQFYSLKDTGITDLLRTGVPAVKVRDQARHYNLNITESYISRATTYDEDVLNSDFNF